MLLLLMLFFTRLMSRVRIPLSGNAGITQLVRVQALCNVGSNPTLNFI